MDDQADLHEDAADPPRGYKRYLVSDADIPIRTVYRKLAAANPFQVAAADPDLNAPSSNIPNPSTQEVFVSQSCSLSEANAPSSDSEHIPSESDEFELFDEDIPYSEYYWNYESWNADNNSTDDEIDDYSDDDAVFPCVSPAKEQATSAAPSDRFDTSASTDDSAQQETPPTTPPDDSNLDEKPNGCNYTKFEILLMILCFAFRFALTNVAITQLLKLVNIILGGKFLPSSSYLFWKVFRSNLPTQIHFYCPKCMLYIGEKGSCDVKTCPECEQSLYVDKMNNGHFFLTIPLGEQIKRKLEGPEGSKIINFRKNRKSDDSIISDFFDCTLFSDLERNAKLGDKDVTVTVGADGSQCFDSGRGSVWPIQFRINEMDLKERFSALNQHVCGLWFGRKKINMITYFTPFVKECKELAKKGITWFNRATKTFETTRVFVTNFVVDAVAKAPILNMTQFNGYFGCNVCYQKGESLEELSNQIRYSHDPTVTERKDETIRQDMKNALQTGKKVNGMFGPSALSYLPFFNCVFGPSIDSMHGIFLGVTEYLFCTVWTAKSNHSEPFYLDNNALERIDTVLLSIRPPSHISRKPRPISQAADYKANEWRMWLLYYGPICLFGILPTRYYKNFCRLSFAIYKLLQKEIKRDELAKIGEALNSFHKEFEKLYGLRYMTYNLHLTMHLKKSVVMNGPLWANSAFPFESGNGFVVNLVSGSKGVPLQIARKYGTFYSIPDFVGKHSPMKEEVIDFSDSLLSIHRQPRLKKAASFNGITVVGDPFQKIFIPTPQESTLFTEKGIPLDSLYSLKRIIFNGQTFSAPKEDEEGKPTTKRDDSFVKLHNNGPFCRIKELITSSVPPNKVFALVNILNMSKQQKCPASHIKSCGVYLYDSNFETGLVEATSLEQKCVSMVGLDDQKYVSECFYNNDRD